MENENNTSNDLREIKEMLQALAGNVAKQDERLSRLEMKGGEPASPLPPVHSAVQSRPTGIGLYDSSFGAVTASVPPPPPPPPPLVSNTVQSKSSVAVDPFSDSFGFSEKRDIPPPPPPDAESRPAVFTPKANIEEQIGVTWFSRIGMIALILGVSYFLKYAFDNNWIGPIGRVVLGLLGGVALLAIGERTIRKYFAYGQLLTGGGLAMLYLSFYAAFNFYHLISAPVAFFFMAMVTALGVLLGLLYDAKALVITAILGGFGTPLMVSTGTNQQVALFSYILLLDAGVLAVSLFKRWHAVNFIGFVGTFFLASGWFDSFYTKDQMWSTLFFYTLFFLTYSCASIAYNLLKKEVSTGMEQVLSLLTGLLYFGAGYAIIDPLYPNFTGSFAVVLAVYYLLLAFAVRSATPNDGNLRNFLAVLSSGFVTLAVPLQFDANIITLGWLLEALLLTYAGVSSRDFMIKGFGLVVSVLAVIRMFFFDSMLAVSEPAIFNERFFTYLFGVSVLFIIAYLWKGDEMSVPESKTVASFFFVIANILALFAGTLEIQYGFNNAIGREREAQAREFREASEDGLYAEVPQEANVSVAVHSENIRLLENKRNISTSIFWLLYSAVVLLAGAYRRHRTVQNWSAVLSIFALCSILANGFWKIASLSLLERILLYSLIILATYLLGVLWKMSRDGSAKDNAVVLAAAFFILANVLTLSAGSVEISKHYEALIAVEQKKIVPIYYDWRNPQDLEVEDPNKAVHMEISRLESKSSVSLSLFWIFYSVILLVSGIIRRSKYLRVGGLALLSFAILKLFFYDLWNLGQLYRIISSITLGVVLLSISFAYQRFKDTIKEII